LNQDCYHCYDTYVEVWLASTVNSGNVTIVPLTVEYAWPNRSYFVMVVVSTASMRVLVDVNVEYALPTGPPRSVSVVVSTATNMTGFVARVMGELKVAV